MRRSPRPKDPSGLRPPIRPALAGLALLVLGVAPADAGPTGPNDARTDDPTEEERIDALFEDLDSTRSPGCAVGVAEPDGMRYAQAYGMANLDHDVPLRSSTVFRIGSVSKQFAAAAAVLLELDGHLSIDDEAHEHFPDLPDFGEPVTLRQVLNHTSGLRDWLTLRSLAGKPGGEGYTRQDVHDLMAGQQDLNFAPGEEHLYSNTGYLFLADLVEDHAGVSMREFTRERLFEPLGMESTRFHDDPDEVIRRRAVGYVPGEDGVRISTSPLDVVGAGGLLSTVEDFARWGHFLIQPDAFPGVPSELAERLLERGVLSNGDTIDYALGISHGELRGLPTIGHGGSWQGYRANFLAFPEQEVSIAVFCNVSTGNPGGRAAEVAQVVLEDRMEPVVEEEPQDEAEPDDAGEAEPEPAPEDLEAYAGDYRSPELEVTYRVRVEDGGLVLRTPEPRAGDLEPEGEDRFRSGGTVFRFIRDADGSVNELRLDAGRVRNLRLERLDP